MKPIIGLNVDVSGTAPKIASVQANYYESISKAGGIPLLIPPMPKDDLQNLIGKLDGVLFIGGRDYCPSLYGREREDKTSLLHQDRLNFDLLLLEKTIENNHLPFLGICAGAQALNISFGGDLIQHIPDKVPDSKIQHSSENGWKNGFAKHVVRLTAGSRLQQIYGKDELNVPTSHHQSVDNLGRGLLSAAEAEDGIIEAVELTDHPFVIGVQWHPERDYEANKKLFEAFIHQAIQTKSIKH